MTCVESILGTNLCIARYLAFMQPFLLVSVAVLLRRIPDGLIRNGFACILLINGLGLHLDFVDSLEIDKKPGARAAAARIDANRSAGEPVIAVTGLLYFPMLYHTKDRADWHVYAEGGLAHYLGGPVAVEGDIIDRVGMDALSSPRAWVVTTSGAWGRRGGMYIPADWRKEREQAFAEVMPWQKDVVVEVYSVPAKGGDRP
jgi:hypothetical protein